MGLTYSECKRAPNCSNAVVTESVGYVDFTRSRVMLVFSQVDVKLALSD